ncbi:MAG: GHKL domain-containing protein [Bacteroidetes bacterium]|nr:MAG: GHKL domain-containing protein [Bacteroidota bacterium]
MLKDDSQIFSTFIPGFQQFDMATGRQKKIQAEDYYQLSSQILLLTSCYERRIEYIKEVANLLLGFSSCDSIELWIKKDIHYQFIEVVYLDKDSFSYSVNPFLHQEKQGRNNIGKDLQALDILCQEIFLGYHDSLSPYFTENGSFWSGNADKSIQLTIDRKDPIYPLEINLDNVCKSFALIPLSLNNKTIGLIRLQSEQRGFFTKKSIDLYEHVGLTFASSLANQKTHEELNERIKELTCLYGIAKIVEPISRPLDEIFHDILNLLPPAWQYPEITCGQILFDGHVYSTGKIDKYSDKQAADIIVSGKKRGSVEVVYLEEMPRLDEGPFLKEERSLINTVAENVAFIIGRKEAAEERAKLQLQLRHADRLATIGQLTAGVAHELNEPLGNILGLAQLASKSQRLPKQVKQDLNRIITISLDAREIIKHLMIFARQKKPEKTRLNLNTIVNEGLVFFESRCSKEGIELVRSLSPELPEIIADRTQIHQVLVNLVTNAIQAMPEGGRLMIRTEAAEHHVALIIEDTGSGITDEVKKQMFIPFFTTKEVGQGTGIGLSVVHGVITSHNGIIKVESETGIGSKFEIQLPINECIIN